MNAEEIRRLVKIVEESDIAELEISRWGRKIKISKYFSHAGNSDSGVAAHYAFAQRPSGRPAGSPASESEAGVLIKGQESETSTAGEEFHSPMVGTFYRAPAPDADPYVKSGDSVQKGQVLCIIEAMKLMNEVEADFPCKVVKILVENGQPVEYNQPLFIVERLS